jgi:hypothetical protein
MGQKKIEKLEELVDTLTRELRSLRSENRRLNEDNIRLVKELESVAVDVKKNQAKLERLALLERSCQKMETNNVTARGKIQNMIAELEKSDWS